MSLIGFSAQICAYNKESQRIFGASHVLLNRIFLSDEKMCGYFKNLEYFSIIFRICGKEGDFDGGEGPEFLKKVRGEQVYTIDLTIPVSAWQNKTEIEIREYLVNGISQCFELLKKKAIKIKEVIDEEKLDNDFKLGLQKYMNTPLPEIPD
ncbi:MULTISPECIES: hypothetical protein [Pasteurellaceae]|uniref:Uncharacterized protein n=1 Tax=Pasteurella atlantica TaxID=2827233 RepID=A0AAW8CHH7_9PAST|nr:hypothetical protein [Pasteurella atlantica]MBR0573674.1 hypothetical protein [Pasteurella atlantica]MDP8039429.1 hypothetical protein [Pasteurella atlantica]MDP8041521.1 hypothetical protein [Pasteurella atlantica]MDP8043554.1 hypothetical protein [Pasteurella atlantica]MDP8045742.1 hypothetical protein [Pasteurella atlantica]